MKQPAVHLRAHSYYSFLEGLASPGELANTAFDLGMPALGLTDRYGLTGAIEFYTACHTHGVKPILGLEIPVVHAYGTGDLVLIAKDLSGWQHICRLSSILQTRAHRDYSKGVDFDQVKSLTSGVICLSAGKNGLARKLLDQHREIDAKSFLRDIDKYFSNNFYIEIQLHETGDGLISRELSSLASQLGLPTIATHSIYYLSPDNADLQRTVSAIRLNTDRKNLEFNDIAPADAYFITSDQLLDRFSEFPEAISAIGDIIEKCQLELPLGISHYPNIELPHGSNANEILETTAFAGAKQKYGSVTNEIENRLKHEIKIIQDRGYASLFLIVQDILGFARKNSIPTSSRGSAASSLIAYCLDITSPDPIALDLYFERFLNPARHTPPDIDIDICSTRRDKLIDYVYTKYGFDRVAMVATINRFRRRSALLEVAKSYGLSQKEIKDMTKTLPWRGWGPAYRESRISPFGDLITRFPSGLHQKIIRQAEELIDTPHHLSIHPGGIVISPIPMNNLVPTHLASKGVIITQFDLHSIESLGLIKIDLLGIRGLSVLGDVSEIIHSWQRTDYPSSLAVLDSIPTEDAKTSALIQSANTIGCFQIESPGMRLTLREIQATRPDDLMIALALYRPGPLTGGLKEAFVRRHLGQEPVVDLHPSLSGLLQDTHGVILYQEQVLRIASELAGLSLADADLLRRAMSHFDPGKRMISLKHRFIEGAYQYNQVPPERAEMIWELMAAFAGYGFPKAHAASYAQIGWKSAWCKTHYPAEFMAAVLANQGGYYPQRIYLNEARRMGIKIRPPHVNHAHHRYLIKYPDGEPIVFVGLNQVRSLTEKTISRIIKERPFKNIEDLLTRVDPQPLEIENLIKIGALSGMGTIPELLQSIQKRSWKYRQPSLFEISGTERVIAEWDLVHRVNAQQTILGVSIDAHPLELIDYNQRKRAHGWISSSEAITMIGDHIQMVGIRQTLLRIQGSDQNPYYALELEDLEGVFKVFLPKELYNYKRKILYGYEPIIVSGVVANEARYGEPILIADRIDRLS